MYWPRQRQPVSSSRNINTSYLSLLELPKGEVGFLVKSHFYISKPSRNLICKDQKTCALCVA